MNITVIKREETGKKHHRICKYFKDKHKLQSITSQSQRSLSNQINKRRVVFYHITENKEREEKVG